MEDLIINDNIVIPADELKISAVRSSGPGGQNVNKVSTCVELRFNPKNSTALPEYAITKLLEKNKSSVIRNAETREYFRQYDFLVMSKTS